MSLKLVSTVFWKNGLLGRCFFLCFEGDGKICLDHNILTRAFHFVSASAETVSGVKGGSFPPCTSRGFADRGYGGMGMPKMFLSPSSFLCAHEDKLNGQWEAVERDFLQEKARGLGCSQPLCPQLRASGRAFRDLSIWWCPRDLMPSISAFQYQHAKRLAGIFADSGHSHARISLNVDHSSFLWIKFGRHG